MARRYRSLHFNLQEGQNVVYHREHISPRNRHPKKVGALKKFDRRERRKWKSKLRDDDYLASLNPKKNRKKKY